MKARNARSLSPSESNALAIAFASRKLQTNRTMNTESDTPRTDALMPDQWYKRTMYDHIEVMETHARQLERELNDAMTALRNLTHEIGRHEGASMMHPRLTRAIAAAEKLLETK
jgi:hypothetical protein